MADDSAETTRQISHEAYKILRSYIDEENKLLNYRMTWVLTINGFLFATYAIAVQKFIERSSPVCKVCAQSVGGQNGTVDYTYLSVFLVIISVMGLVICRISRVGIVGARRSVFFIEKFVEEKFDLEKIHITSSSVKYKGHFHGIILRHIRVGVYKFSNRARWVFLKNFLNKIVEKISDNENQVINCVHVKDVGLVPFVTGGGYYKPTHKTRMSSLKFVHFLFGVWVFLLCCSIFVIFY